MAYSDNNNIVNSNKTDIGNLTSPPSEGLGEILHITHIPTWNTAALTTQASAVV